MSYDAKAGVVYMGTWDYPFFFRADPQTKKNGVYEWKGGSGTNTGMDVDLANFLETNLTEFPEPRGYLGAFDLIKGEYKWQIEQPFFWNGGVLATAGGLLFQGGDDGHLKAYDKDTGEELWSFDTYTSILAPPITYEMDDRQYVAIMTGASASSFEIGGDNPIPSATAVYGSHSRILVFALGGNQKLDVPAKRILLPHRQPATTADADTLRRGGILYHSYCTLCHGTFARGSGGPPDLRMMSAATRQIFSEIVLKGAYENAGMGNFSDALTEADSDAILSYILHRANLDRNSLLEAEKNSAGHQ